MNVNKRSFFKRQIHFELKSSRFHDSETKSDELHILGNYLYKEKYRNKHNSNNKSLNK